MMSYKSYDRLTNFEYKFIHLCYRQLEQIKKKSGNRYINENAMGVLCYRSRKKKCYRLD